MCRGRLADLFHALNAKLRGDYNYYGVHGNYASLQRFFTYAMRILFKWLNRRSQRRSYKWTGFKTLLNDFAIERPRMVGRPKKRTAASGA
jgi:RNA-directed DNA polymerase